MLLLLPRIDVIYKWRRYKFVISLRPASPNRIEYVNEDDALNSEDVDFGIQS